MVWIQPIDAIDIEALALLEYLQNTIDYYLFQIVHKPKPAVITNLLTLREDFEIVPL